MQGLDLDRITTDGKIAGVCAGVADRWRIDPLLVRVAAVVLALFSGVGAVLYGAAWLLLPAKGENDAPLMKAFPSTRQVPAVAWYITVGALCIVAMATLSSVLPISSGPVIAVAALWYFGLYRPKKRREQNERDQRAAGGPGPGSTQGVGSYPSDGTFAPYDPRPQYGLGVEPEGYTDELPTAGPTQPWRSGTSGSAAPWGPGPDVPPHTTGPAPSQQPSGPTSYVHHTGFQHTPSSAQSLGTAHHSAAPPPSGPASGSRKDGRRRTRSDRDTDTARRVRTIAISAIVAAMLALAVFDGIGLMAVPFAAYAATALLIVGVALVVSAWTGRARGLLPMGGVLLVLTMFGLGSVHAPDATAVHQRSYASVAQMPSEEKVEFGTVRLDLSDLEVNEDHTYTLQVESGSVEVNLPPDANVIVRAATELGSISMPSESSSGVEVATEFVQEPNPGGPMLVLDLRVELGTVAVIQP